jgi:hypothetical protein
MRKAATLAHRSPRSSRPCLTRGIPSPVLDRHMPGHETLAARRLTIKAGCELPIQNSRYRLGTGEGGSLSWPPTSSTMVVRPPLVAAPSVSRSTSPSPGRPDPPQSALTSSWIPSGTERSHHSGTKISMKFRGLSSVQTMGRPANTHGYVVRGYEVGGSNPRPMVFGDRTVLAQLLRLSGLTARQVARQRKSLRRRSQQG